MEDDTNINNQPRRKTTSTTNPFEASVSTNSMTQLPDWNSNMTKDEPTNSTAILILANSIGKLIIQVYTTERGVKSEG